MYWAQILVTCKLWLWPWRYDLRSRTWDTFSVWTTIVWNIFKIRLDRIYGMDMDFGYVFTVTLTFEMWPLVMVMIHPWTIDNYCVKYPYLPSGCEVKTQTWILAMCAPFPCHWRYGSRSLNDLSPVHRKLPIELTLSIHLSVELHCILVTFHILLSNSNLKVTYTCALDIRVVFCNIKLTFNSARNIEGITTHIPFVYWHEECCNCEDRCHELYSPHIGMKVCAIYLHDQS